MDTGTALAAATLMLLANGGVLGLMLRHLSADLRQTAISWQAGTLLVASGCILFILSPYLSSVIALPLANGLIMLGLTAYWQALRQFYGYPTNLLLLLPASAATLCLFWYTAFDPQTKIRIMIVSVAWLILMGGSVKTLQAHSARSKVLSHRILMALFIGMMLFTALRAMYYGQIDMESNFNVVDNSSWMNLTTAMLEVVLPIIGTTAFMLMCSERIRQQSQTNQHKTETLSYIGHDLRAPLATIVGYTRLLRKTGTPEQTQHIRAIERSANYQLTLIDEILEYAKHELKPLDIRVEAVPLATLLDDIAQQANSLSRQQKNRFEFQAMTPLPALVSTDARRLQQILLNLISNAAKFTRNGLIRLTVSASTNGNTTALAFAVTDSGAGIDPAIQASIFKAFEQVQERPGSAGLGLYIAQRIVENLGGELRLESRPGMGSCFSFTIPAEPLSAETITLPGYQSAHSAPSESTMAPLVDTPPKQVCIDLAKFAHNGQLSDIEDWLQQHSLSHADCQKFFQEVREALQMLDFEHIKSMALAGVQRPLPG